MRPETLAELCERYGIQRPADTRGQRFDNFGGFNQVYWAASHCIRSREDLARLVLEVAEDAAAQGVLWIEPAFDADRYSTLRDGSPHRLFQAPEEGWRFALAAAETASRATGVGIGYMSAIDRTRPLEQGLERAQLTARLDAQDLEQMLGPAAGESDDIPGRDLVAFQEQQVQGPAGAVASE